MRIEYRRTFQQFTDNYIASYYSAGVRPFTRLLGGPALIFLGIAAVILLRRPTTPLFIEILIWFAGGLLALYGLSYTLRPVINIGLVWLRRDEFLSEKNIPIAIELDSENETLLVYDPEGQLKIPLTGIRSIQHRSESTWILTHSDHLIFIPRHDLLAGDHDAFIAALEAILDANEQKY